MAIGTQADVALASESEIAGLVASMQQGDSVLSLDILAVYVLGPTLGTFIANGSSILPEVKQDARVPAGTNTEIRANDINEIRQALLDCRSAILNILNGTTVPATNASILTGTGSPNGVVPAYPGSIYLNLSGGTSQTLWVQESTVYSNTGWVAK